MAVVIDVARPSDDSSIRRLMRQEAMPGHIRLAFPREPRFSLGCAATGDDHRILVARSEFGGSVIGVACRSVRSVFLNGRPQRIGYLGQLRVHRSFRGRWLVSRGLAMLQRIHREDPVPAYLASIVDGNREAHGVLVSRRRRAFPEFREIARYRTLALPLTRPRPVPRGIHDVAPASIDQLPDIVRFLQTEGARRQLFPVWTEAALAALAPLGLTPQNICVARRHGAIVGVMALWDQSAYKQAVVHGYSGWLRVIAPLSRMVSRWLPRPAMPPTGGEIRSASAALVCVAQDDPAVFRILLDEVYNLACARRLDYLLIGLDARDPLLKIARTRRHFSYPSRLYLASWDNGGSCEHLDDRPVYVDLGTL